MSNGAYDETRDLWNRVADDWRRQVGDEGDANRILNSDPVLWAFAGDVKGRTVLDAGCGTGYLSKKLQDRGARAGPFSFRKEIANQAPNELKDFVPRGASLRRHAPMTQNPFMKADTHDTTASSAHRSFL